MVVVWWWRTVDACPIQASLLRSCGGGTRPKIRQEVRRGFWVLGLCLCFAFLRRFGLGYVFVFCLQFFRFELVLVLGLGLGFSQVWVGIKTGNLMTDFWRAKNEKKGLESCKFCRESNFFFRVLSSSSAAFTLVS